ncbi:MAG: ParB/Srx family N-terminal domain-containing protein [Verrucomicrobiales bacterium]
MTPQVRDWFEAKRGKKEHGETADEVSREWAAQVAEAKRNGVLVALKVVKRPKEKRKPQRYWIVDGVHRWLAAREAEIEKLPCEAVGEAEVENVIAAMLIGRKHVSKGLKAWTAVHLNRALLENTPGQKGYSHTEYGIQSREGREALLRVRACGRRRCEAQALEYMRTGKRNSSVIDVVARFGYRRTNRNSGGAVISTPDSCKNGRSADPRELLRPRQLLRW